MNLKGIDYQYEVYNQDKTIDIEFRRKNVGKKFIVRYDPEHMDVYVQLYEVLADGIDDLGGRYETKFKEITELYENKVKLLQDEINLHKRIIAQLKEENTMLRNKLKDNKIE